MKNTQNYKRELLAKAAELRRTVISKDEIAIERAPEMLDEIQRTAERELALNCLSRNWHTGSQVAEALARISDGSFGICASCEEEISERRLAAIPWAKLCIRCQEKADEGFDDAVVEQPRTSFSKAA